MRTRPSAAARCWRSDGERPPPTGSRRSRPSARAGGAERGVWRSLGVCVGGGWWVAGWLKAPRSALRPVGWRGGVGGSGAVAAARRDLPQSPRLINV